MADPPINGDSSVGETIVRVVEDGRAYASAQVTLYKTMASARLRAAKLGIVFITAAAALATSALTGLVIGSIFALAPQIGPWLATLVVVGVVSVFAGILGWLAVRRLVGAFGAIE